MGNLCECRGKAGGRCSDVQPDKDKPLQQVTEDDLDSNEEDDDVVDELPMPSATVQAKNRQSVSAEAYGEWNKKTNFVPPVYEKTPEAKQRIQKIVDNSFLFSSLDYEDIDVVLGAFKEVSVKKGETLIQQGADGDKLYLIESGEAEVFKEITNETTQQKQTLKVNTMKEGDTVGELALMYNAPRAATVIAATDLKLWSLDRETFSHIVRDAAAKNREMYEDSLKEVELLKDVDPYERSKVADALKTQLFQAGDEIIREGQEGDTFYLLLDGEAEAIKGGKVVMEYKRGGYFGELALLKNQPRAATVKAKTNCKVAYMDRRSFKRLLGPLEALLMRNMDHYRAVMKQLGLDTQYLDK
ncbi:cAMP-dependent protein kinase regulatory subunit [Cyclospora cayetanensis]|uniref:cAMP-dependent protein kinase regulatory subunit n=1 Tax=Cyclospora cayetanensis TaxID=88456 RepID=A0A6P6RUI3_9EIME|nr:cAMP-dependent protein kinase regulatory subunit [Cyclospora cayetanensis]